MKFQNILTADCTLCSVPVNSKKRVLEKICSVAVNKLPELDQHELLDSLLEREKMGSTGIGNGIAIPHGRLTNTKQVIVVILTTEQAIPFDAIDNRDVDIFVALFVPENACKEHLSTLQSIAKVFSDKNICKQVRKCTSDDSLYTIVNQLG